MEKEELQLKKAIREVFEKVLEEKESEGDIESKVTFEDIMNDKDKFLEIFSPWHGTNGKQLIKTFVDKVQNNSNDKFSWFDILNEDFRWKNLENNKRKDEIADQNKHLNMRYQIPIHFHGNIDDAVIFHCMENPRGYLEQGVVKNWDKKGDFSLKYYYEKSAEERKEKKQNNSISEILKERHHLTDFTVNQVTKIIYSGESNLLQELNEILDSKDKKFNKKIQNKELKENGYYYLPTFYKELIQEKPEKSNFILDFKKINKNKEDVKSIAEKICNLEIYPFSCEEPQLGNGQIGETLFLHSDLSRLGVYIVLRRIYKYLQEKEKNQKLFIIFRKYGESWEKLLNKLISKDILEILEENFFYCQRAVMGNGITSGNVISVSHYKEYLESKKNKLKNNSDLEEEYKNWKKEAFDKITNGLPRITDEKENNKA